MSKQETSFLKLHSQKMLATVNLHDICTMLVELKLFNLSIQQLKQVLSKL